jgi:hypothetical protein
MQKKSKMYGMMLLYVLLQGNQIRGTRNPICGTWDLNFVARGIEFCGTWD